MQAGNLHSYVKTVTAILPISLATAAVGTYGIAVDASGGGDRAQFVIQVGAMTATTGRFGCKVRQSTSSTGTYSDYTSAALTTVVPANANKVFEIDVAVSGTKPYLKLYGTSTKTVIVSAICNLYRGSKRNPHTVAFTESIVKP